MGEQVRLNSSSCDDGVKEEGQDGHHRRRPVFIMDRNETHEPQIKSTNEIRFARDCHMTHPPEKTRRIK